MDLRVLSPEHEERLIVWMLRWGKVSAPFRLLWRWLAPKAFRLRMWWWNFWFTYERVEELSPIFGRKVYRTVRRWRMNRRWWRSRFLRIWTRVHRLGSRPSR
jgi:hypothetical protein